MCSIGKVGLSDVSTIACDVGERPLTPPPCSLRELPLPMKGREARRHLLILL
jgi:hypothetical protein